MANKILYKPLFERVMLQAIGIAKEGCGEGGGLSFSIAAVAIWNNATGNFPVKNTNIFMCLLFCF